ncbi:SusC/RagA family TonB-linked outer membrane protein [Pedobacter sp. MC2016-15]|uniref:SusC/RagA family TonB-linked outer membrane protein n=1 Tax=Pedobacter sp. MC2016-15 TaxID=2994473 RepID=UPI0022467B4A|nr:SusC/RagA family TonB-linked outer membrane protein [Pedobacter sp. MC2016-15]MCX2478176.1 SusC/RagA family TonB-linked outer membrane protein [Pedobacter sp. MC2016-15]
MAENVRFQDPDPRISLNVSKIPVTEVLRRINKLAKVDFAYGSDVLSSSDRVTINVKDEKLSVVLKMILEPLNLQFSIGDNLIIIEAVRPRNKLPAAKASISPDQQQIPIKGTVTDQKGLPLPGVSVKLKGSTIATTTTSDGRYSLLLPDGSGTLIFTFMGYLVQEIAIAGKAVADVAMKEQSQELTEVVVTALGIKRDKKSLAYAVSEINGSEFTQARENNVANALTGKVAGVNATGLSTGPGGSSRVIIRGNGSLNGSNQPLYVINGMPMDNSTPGGSATSNGGSDGTGNVDRGDGISGINPDDIESISVLKGGTAAALYGARAANGVILITTKKGRAQKGVGIDFNSTFNVDRVIVSPDWQYEYGQGTDGTKPVTQSQALASGRRSFGARIDGSSFIAADGLSHTYAAVKDNVKDFYKTGTSFTNTLAFTGGNDNLTYRFSGSDLSSNSILPNSTYNRKTANLSLNGKVGSKVSFEALAQYNVENARNRPTAGDALGNPNWTPLLVANTTDVDWLKPGFNGLGNEIPWNDASIATNGYFVVNKFRQKDTKNRFIGQAGLTFQLVKNLTAKATVSRDFYNYDYEYILPSGTLYTPNGQYAALKADNAETNGLLTLNYSGKITDDFTLNALAGGNQQRSVYNLLSTTGRNFTIPYFYSTTNLSTIASVPTNNRTAINSLFASADLGFRSYLFLTLTGRQDWFSTLSPENNHLFYPSIGGSFVLSDAFALPKVISFAKIRASWAQVGGGAPDPYQINLGYTSQPSSGQPIQNVTSTTISNRNLQPYTSTTTEAGIEAKLLNNRLGVDLTFYNRKTTNDIVYTAISGTTGFNNVILNVGELDNRGVEALFTGTPAKTKNFSWNVSYNVSYNKNTVQKLSEGLNQIQMASSVNSYAFINNIVGQSYGSIVGTRMQKDASGNTVFNATTGLPVTTGLEVLGKGVAPWTMGISNDFRFKDFTLSILVDGKFGNKIFSLMDVYATRLGLNKMTLPGRDGGLTVTGVTQSGAPYTRFIPVSGLQSYYDNYKSYTDLFVYNAGFVKLRQIILSYALPVKKIAAVQSAAISLVARNLLTIYKQTDNFDPEQSFTNSSSQGFESIGLPRTRTIGLNLMVKF